MELAETNCHIQLMKKGYPYRCQGFRFIEERSDTPGYFQRSQYWADKGTGKCPYSTTVQEQEYYSYYLQEK